jgi:hypothetical protein
MIVQLNEVQMTELLIVFISSIALFASGFVFYTLYRDAKEEKKAAKDKALHTKKLRSVGNAK